jgi:hypothetical protein
MTLILDAGALLAVERGDRDVLAFQPSTDRPHHVGLRGWPQRACTSRMNGGQEPSTRVMAIPGRTFAIDSKSASACSSISRCSAAVNAITMSIGDGPR